MKKLLSVAVAVSTIPALASAHENTTVRVSEPSDSQIEAARAETDAVMKLIEAGQPEAALERITEKSLLLKEKKSEFNLLLGQIKNAELLFGPVEQCLLSEYSHDSALRIEFVYICQHRDYLLRWTLSTDNLPGGWTITNFRFSDDF